MGDQYFTNLVEGIKSSFGKNFSTGEEPAKKPGFMSNVLSSFSDSREGLEKMYEVGNKEITKLQNKHDALSSKLEAEVNRCTQEQENIKAEIETVTKEMDGLRAMIDKPETKPETKLDASESSSFSDSSTDPAPDVPATTYATTPDAATPDATAPATTPDATTYATTPDATTPDATTAPSAASLAESQKPTAVEINTQFPRMGGTRRRKKRTKRRRRRGCSRKKSKSTRGRGRLR